MQILVTSAFGADGDGFGSLLSFALDGTPKAAFNPNPSIADPRGLTVSSARQTFYVNSGDDHILSYPARFRFVHPTPSRPSVLMVICIALRATTSSHSISAMDVSLIARCISQDSMARWLSSVHYSRIEFASSD
jgi:hypothetical protein